MAISSLPHMYRKLMPFRTLDRVILILQRVLRDCPLYRVSALREACRLAE